MSVNMIYQLECVDLKHNLTHNNRKYPVQSKTFSFILRNLRFSVFLVRNKKQRVNSQCQTVQTKETEKNFNQRDQTYLRHFISIYLLTTKIANNSYTLIGKNWPIPDLKFSPGSAQNQSFILHLTKSHKTLQ